MQHLSSTSELLPVKGIRVRYFSNGCLLTQYDKYVHTDLIQIACCAACA